MSETDNGQTVAAAASTQVKLCPYDEEEPAIWFRLIRAQFTMAGIKQKLRYTMLWPGVNKYLNKPNSIIIAVFGMSSVATGIW